MGGAFDEVGVDLADVGSGVGLEDLSVGRPSLEDVYLELVTGAGGVAP